MMFLQGYVVTELFIAHARIHTSRLLFPNLDVSKISLEGFVSNIGPDVNTEPLSGPAVLIKICWPR